MVVIYYFKIPLSSPFIKGDEVYWFLREHADEAIVNCFSHPRILRPDYIGTPE
jgi:hypothetical protein